MGENDSEYQDFVVEMAIEFWRLEKRFGKAGSFLSAEERQLFADQMQRMRRVLEKFEIEIHDPKGEIYTDGRSLKAIYIEEVSDFPAGECRIIETVKPCVCYKGCVIFSGEVIVGQGKTPKPNKVSP